MLFMLILPRTTYEKAFAVKKKVYQMIGWRSGEGDGRIWHGGGGCAC